MKKKKKAENQTTIRNFYIFLAAAWNTLPGCLRRSGNDYLFKRGS